MKATEQYLPVVLFIVLNKVTFEYVIFFSLKILFVFLFRSDSQSLP